MLGDIAEKQRKMFPSLNRRPISANDLAIGQETQSDIHIDVTIVAGVCGQKPLVRYELSDQGLHVQIEGTNLTANRFFSAREPRDWNWIPK
jgi:hypothetical protein